MLDVHEVTGRMRTGLFVANNPINAIDLYGTDETTANTIESLNFGYETIANSGAAAWTIGINNASGNITVYTSGWSTGNGSVAIAGRVGAFAEQASSGLTIIGVGYNVYGMASGQEPVLQGSANIGVSVTAYGLTQSGLTIGGVEAGGPLGWSLGGGYLAGSLINAFVPGVSENAQDFFQPFTDWYYGAYDFGPIQPLFPDSGPIEPLFPFYVPPCK